MEVTKILILLGILCLCKARINSKDLANRQPEEGHETKIDVQFERNSDTASGFDIFHQLKFKSQKDSTLLFRYLLRIGSGYTEEKPVILAPENVSTSTGPPGNLVVFWRSPLSDSGLLEGYKVFWKCNEKQGEAEVAVAKNSFTIIGLTPCQKCDVYVTGRNRSGKDAQSKYANTHGTVSGIAGPLEPNDAVVSVTALVSDCRTKDVNVTWEVEEETIDVGNFNVSWICQNNTSGSKQVFNALNTNLTSLNPECNITVAKVNCAGIGPSSEPIAVQNNCVECPPDFKALPFGCYHVRNYRTRHWSSESYCSSKNGSSLYVAKSLAEFEGLKAIFRNTTSLINDFLGLSLRENTTSRKWYWGNSTLEQPMGTPYWRNGEPDTYEECAVMHKSYNFDLFGMHCGSFIFPLCFIRHN